MLFNWLLINLLGLLMKTLGVAWFNATCLRLIRSGLLTHSDRFPKLESHGTARLHRHSWSKQTRGEPASTLRSPENHPIYPSSLCWFRRLLGPAWLVVAACQSTRGVAGEPSEIRFETPIWKRFLFGQKRAKVQILVSQGSAWDRNGERTVWFRRCPAAVKPLLSQARVSQNARQSLNRRGSTCFFLMCKLFCTIQFFHHFTRFEKISGWAPNADR